MNEFLLANSETGWSRLKKKVGRAVGVTLVGATTAITFAGCGDGNTHEVIVYPTATVTEEAEPIQKTATEFEIIETATAIATPPATEEEPCLILGHKKGEPCIIGPS